MTAFTAQLGDQLKATTTSEGVLDVAKRATVLVARSGPYHPAVAAEVDRLPRGGAALRGIRSGIYMAMTAGPQMAMDRIAQVSLGGPPTTPQQVADHRRVMLLGNGALVAAGILAQRAINHSGRSGPIAEVGRAVSGQLAIGAAAATIIAGSDVALGPLIKGSDTQSPSTIAIRVLSARTQRSVLRKVASIVLLPTKPASPRYGA